MNQSQCEFLSQGVDLVLQALSPFGRPAGRGCFPARIDPSKVKANDSDTIREWFLRCVKDAGGNEESFQVEENLAIIAVIDWTDGDRLTYANIQVLRTDTSISDYCISDGIGADYLRLDLDFKALGVAFSHPLPHIHDRLKGPPRFAFEPASKNLVPDFFDFVYRHFFHDKWFQWAQSTWESYYEKTITKSEDIENDPFNVIVEAFKASQYDVLRDRQDNVRKLKRVLQARRDQQFPSLRLDTLASELLAYHHC
jgi:hypothetical protein